MEEGQLTEAPKPKRKYKPRAICTDPELKYLYKKKPGRKGWRKKYEPERTDAEKRRHSRASARSKKAQASFLANHTPEEIKARADHLLKYHELQKHDPQKYSSAGIPDGMNRAQADAAWAIARVQAEKVFTHMVEKGIAERVNPEDFEAVAVLTEAGTEYKVLVPKTDEAKAATAIKEAMVMALGPMRTQQTKLAAIRTVLEWTKAKPASKSEVQVSKAEDWLAAVTQDALKNDGQDGSGPN